jgi:hypothetical protein
MIEVPGVDEDTDAGLEDGREVGGKVVHPVA